MVKPYSPLYLTALTVIANILIHLWLILQLCTYGKIIYTMANDISVENLIKQIIESNVDVGSFAGWNPDYMKEKGHKPPETFFRHQKGDMPTSTLESLIGYTEPSRYEFKPRIEDAQGRKKEDLRYELMDADINILDIMSQREHLRDLALIQEEDKNMFPMKGHTDIHGATKETTDNLLFGLLKLQDLITKSLDWTKKDTEKIEDENEKWYDEMQKKMPKEFPDANPWRK